MWRFCCKGLPRRVIDDEVALQQGPGTPGDKGFQAVLNPVSFSTETILLPLVLDYGLLAREVQPEQSDLKGIRVHLADGGVAARRLLARSKRLKRPSFPKLSNEVPEIRIFGWGEGGRIETLERLAERSLRSAMARRFESKKWRINADRSPVMGDMVSNPIEYASMLLQGVWHLA